MKTEEQVTPTKRAWLQCANWLASCLKDGWDKSDIDALEKLWWEYHDHNGKLKPKSESPSSPAVSGEDTALKKIQEDLKFLADKNDSPLVKCAYSLALAVCEIHLKPSPSPLPATDEEIEMMAEVYAEKYAFRVPYNGTTNFYDDEAYKHCKYGFIAGYKASHPTKRPG